MRYVDRELYQIEIKTQDVRELPSTLTEIPFIVKLMMGFYHPTESWHIFEDILQTVMNIKKIWYYKHWRIMVYFTPKQAGRQIDR